MGWVKLDDSFHSHPKVNRIGLEAAGLYCLSLAYSSHYLTDGHVDEGWVRQKAGRRADRLASDLVATGLWEANGAGWVIHDYHEYNFAAEKIRRKRAADSARKAAGK